MAARQAKTGKPKPFKLNQRHERFCRFIIQGLTQKAAYAEAGFAGGWVGGPAALMKRPEIRRRLQILRDRQRVALNVTMQRLTLDLTRAQEFALATDNASAFVAASMGLAKLHGFLKEDREGDINVFINRPLREPSKELELTPDQWVAKWAPSPIEAPKRNGHGNGHDGNGKDQG